MSDFLSVVVPAFNETEVLPEFHRRITEVMRATGADYEILYVDDGSTDDTAAVLNAFRERDEGSHDHKGEHS